MSSLQRPNAPFIDKRLASITRTAADLKAQLYELNKLRDQVRKVRQSARSYWPVRANVK